MTNEAETSPRPLQQLKEEEKVKDAQKLYSRRASLYERFFVNFLGWGSKLEAFFRTTDYVKPNFRLLDAGCGTGIVTRTLHKLTSEKGLQGVSFFAFDLTENMLKIFGEWIRTQGATSIELKQANVLEMGTLPLEWNDFDLIVTSAMLEYLPKEKVKDAIMNLKNLLKRGGKLLVFITRRSLTTRIVAGSWWKARTFTQSEVQELYRSVGFEKVEFKSFAPDSWWDGFILVIEAVK